MAVLKVIGSSSSGNGYIVECENEILIIELGCRWEDYLKSLNYDKGLSKVCGCIVSHRHGDHLNNKTFAHASMSGIPIYSCEEVVKKFNAIELAPLKKKTHIGGFTIEPISVSHNAECYSYIIEHKEFGKMLFMTDLNEFPYNIRGVNHWLIEANYSKDVILQRIMDGEGNQSMSENHLSIEQTREILKRNFNFYTQTIVLLHLSDSNSDENGFIREIQETLGFSNVLVAQRGLEVELNLEDF